VCNVLVLAQLMGEAKQVMTVDVIACRDVSCARGMLCGNVVLRW
jgi:hypothetical protein